MALQILLLPWRCNVQPFPGCQLRRKAAGSPHPKGLCNCTLRTCQWERWARTWKVTQKMALEKKYRKLEIMEQRWHDLLSLRAVHQNLLIVKRHRTHITSQSWKVLDNIHGLLTGDELVLSDFYYCCRRKRDREQSRVLELTLLANLCPVISGVCFTWQLYPAALLDMWDGPSSQLPYRLHVAQEIWTSYPVLAHQISSFHFHLQGMLLGVVGKVGSGKSSLLAAITGELIK